EPLAQPVSGRLENRLLSWSPPLNADDFLLRGARIASQLPSCCLMNSVGNENSTAWPSVSPHQLVRRLANAALSTLEKKYQTQSAGSAMQSASRRRLSRWLRLRPELAIPIAF